MNITTEKYLDSLDHLPREGQHIVAHQLENEIVVYQAYKPAIAAFAVKNQYLGGPDFSFGRMSWIKPNFLWMMYRCGWGEKENQERVLALWLDKADFEKILEQAVFSAFQPDRYPDRDAWKQDIQTRKVRLQWDPDHDPYGNSLSRRAIQLGLKGEMLADFGKRQIRRVEDLTEFVTEQKAFVRSKQLNQLLVPKERVFQVQDESLKAKIGLD